MIQTIRTDLAKEARDMIKGSDVISGVEYNEYELDGMNISSVVIKDKEGETAMGRPMGKYITADIGRIWLSGANIFEKRVKALSSVLKEIKKEAFKERGSLLVAGLGNRYITSDAIGPLCLDNIIVTRHIKNEKPLIYENLGLYDISAISPGVLGQTGIESADIISSIVHDISPDGVIVIDALASRRLSRLATTIQISTAGISPGSGVGNMRRALNESSLGCPVIAIGVPTVVDAATLAYDAIGAISGREEENEEEYGKIKEYLQREQLNFFVTPKETDMILKKVARLIGYAVNLAFNKDLEYEEMVSLINE